MNKKNTYPNIPKFSEFLDLRRDQNYTVLCGVNNSGKSLLLKTMTQQYSIEGKKPYFLNIQRFFTSDTLNAHSNNPHYYEQLWNNFSSQLQHNKSNFEQNILDPTTVISSFNNEKRKELLELCSELLGNKFSIRRDPPDNECALPHIAMDDQNINVGSTGTRLVLVMLATCMDNNFDSILIDEPELGLGPRIQTVLCDFFADQDRRKKYFPHLNSVFISTHSHLFLDRSNISNNFIVTKEQDNIDIQQVKSPAQFHELQFNLLGNSLEGLFLPSAFIVVEGETDQDYIQKWMDLLFPNNRVVVLRSKLNKKGDVKDKVYSLKECLGDISKSPYKNRIFAIFDLTHNKEDPEKIEGMGIPKENIIIWEKNGIEYYYPHNVMQQLFHCSLEDVIALQIDGDIIKVNNIEKKKADLSKEVTRLMTADSKFPEEFKKKFLAPLARAIGSSAFPHGD